MKSDERILLLVDGCVCDVSSEKKNKLDDLLIGCGFKQSVFEFHSKAQTQLLEFGFDFVERFLAEVSILQHFGL